MNLLSYDVDNMHSGRGFDPHHLHQKEIKMINNKIKGGSNDAIPPEQDKNITKACKEIYRIYV